MTPPATPQPQDPTVEQIDAALKAWNIEGACLQDSEEGEDLNFLCMAAALRAYDSVALQSLREERDELRTLVDIMKHESARAVSRYADECNRFIVTHAERDTLAKELEQMKGSLRYSEVGRMAAIDDRDAWKAGHTEIKAERDRLRAALEECMAQVIQTGCDLGADHMPACVERARRALEET